MSNFIVENYYQIYTEAGIKFERAWFYPRHSYMEFYMRTCGPSHVLLTGTPFDADKTGSYYEIVIGAINADTGAQETHIYRNTELKSKVTSPFVHDCHAMHRYWVSWDGGEVQVGWGVVFTEVITKFSDPSSIGVSTVSFGADQSESATASVVDEWCILKSSGKPPVTSQFAYFRSHRELLVSFSQYFRRPCTLWNRKRTTTLG